MRTLVIYNDGWHPGHIPRAGLEALGAHGGTFDWIDDPAEWSAERMASYPLVALIKSNTSPVAPRPWADDQVQAALLEYVRQGNGLLAIHSGTAGYQDAPTMRHLLGGVFARHPPQCQVTVEPLQGHPLAGGATPFTVWDEHYFMDFDDSQADVFLTTRSEHGAQPAGWTRVEGAGRVCVLTPGHNLDVWMHPSFQTLLGTALHWCASSQG